MGYHSGINGEYAEELRPSAPSRKAIPVEINSKYIKSLQRCCKEEVPEKAIKVETYLKDDTIYFVLPNNYKPVKIVFDNDMDSNIYGGKGNQKLNVDFRSTGYHQDDNCVNISDNTSNSNAYVSIFDSLLDLSKQISEIGYSYEDVDKMFDNMFYNK